MEKRVRIRAFYANYFADGAIARVALRFAGFFNDDRVESDLMGTCSNRSLARYKDPGLYGPEIVSDPDAAPRPIYRDAIPPGPAWALARRLFRPGTLQRFAERRFLSGLRRGDVAYLWPGTTPDLYRRARRRGCRIVTERINTLVENSKRILDEEYGRLGLAPSHGLTAAMIAEERETLALSDIVFSPSPAVTESLLRASVPRARIIETSYGLDRGDILPPRGKSGGRVTALFAGQVCVRKGVHSLLEAWEASGVDARLVVVGRIAPDTRPAFEAALERTPSIEYREYVDDLRPLYGDADFFILPSLEEGSPLVSYLALGAGLPLLVSSMGAGGIVSPGREGLIVDPSDVAGFAAAIALMVSDAGLRRSMSLAASEAAGRYTWDVVAAERRSALLARLGSLASAD